MAEHTPLYDQTLKSGAIFVEEAGWLVPAHFGDPTAEYGQARSGCVLFDRSARGKVEVTGNDAASFLHNLSTNDFKDMPLGAGCELFFTTNKARVVAHGFAYHVRLGNGRSAFMIDLEPGASVKLIQHLDQYLISEQVELADRTTEFAQMHLAGPSAVAVLQQALMDEIPPLEPLQHMERTFGSDATGLLRRRDPLGLHGFDIVCLRSRAETVWQLLLRAGAKPAGREAFETLRVEAGTPIWGADIDESTFAPEVGRNAQAISYTKGCYLGQEPIVMARDRGQVNRTLLTVRLPGPVPHGSPLFRDDKDVGRVMSNLWSPRLGEVIGLAYVRRGNQDPGTMLEVEMGTQRQKAEVMQRST